MWRDDAFRRAGHRRASALGEQLRHEAIALGDAFNLDRHRVDARLDALQSLLDLVAGRGERALVLQLEVAAKEAQGRHEDGRAADEEQRLQDQNVRHRSSRVGWMGLSLQVTRLATTQLTANADVAERRGNR